MSNKNKEIVMPTWRDKQTPVNAANLNSMVQSIKQNSNDIEILSQAMALLNESKLDKVELQKNVLKFYAKEVEKFSISIPIGSGGSGIPGQDGRDGREIELRKGETHIEWNYVGEDNWKQLVSLEELKGPKGQDGAPGQNGADGTPGRDGNDGVTPNITIGEVTTLEAGQQATVTKTGSKENPVFNFGIPKGKDGIGEGGSTTSITVNGQVYQDENGTINLPNYPEVPTKNSELANDSGFITSDDPIDASTLNGKKFSKPMTKEEYDAIIDKDENTIYLIDDDTAINGVPNYSVNDANKILAVNSNGTGILWTIPTSGGEGGFSIRDVMEGEIFCVSNDAPAPPTYGDIVVSTSNISINENESGTFNVSLTKAPSNNQVVSIEVNNGNCTISPTSLTFTPENHATQQTVNIKGVHDNLSYINKNSTITVSSIGVSSKNIDVTIVNIDAEKVLNSISAIYNQGDNVIYPDSDLDSLKVNLVVTAHYDDESTSPINDYLLSGNLTVGSSVITVSYGGKTTTFNVNVTARPTLSSINAVFTQGNMEVYPTTDLDTLKKNLVVKASYSDGSNSVITEYSLSGELTLGMSVITVSYLDKTTTFNVNVIEAPVIDRNSDAYIENGYMYINTDTIRKAGGAVRRTGEDSTHCYFSFNSNAYEYAGILSSLTAEQGRDFIADNTIPFAGEVSLNDFLNGKVECADTAFIISNRTVYYRIPIAPLGANGDDIISALSSVVPKLGMKLNTSKQLTKYTITDEMIETFKSRNSFGTATGRGEFYTGFIEMDSSITGISVNISACACSLGGYTEKAERNDVHQAWHINVGGSRLNYRIPYEAISGDSIEELKAYLKENRLVFYKFN